MQFTLVAYYGDWGKWNQGKDKDGGKPTNIAELITNIQNLIDHNLGNAFRRYELPQIHGTIVGLEGFRTDTGIINANYLSARHERKIIDFTTLFDTFKQSSYLPINIQIGGFDHTKVYPFTSQGLHPYLRSFAIRGNISVAMGWPCEENSYPMKLDSFRRCLNDANILHKYHSSANSIDNDFFFVLGRVARSLLSEERILKTQDKLREHLAGVSIQPIQIERNHLSIIGYDDPQLPEGSWKLSLKEAEDKIMEIIDKYPMENT